MPDIDIDFADRDVILSHLKHRVAKLNTGKKHSEQLLPVIDKALQNAKVKIKDIDLNLQENEIERIAQNYLKYASWFK